MSRLTREDWDSLVTKFQKSGQPARVFAKKHGVTRSALSYNASVRKKTAKNKPRVVSAGFTQVGAPDIIEIEKNGMLLRVPAHLEMDTLKRLIQAFDDNE